MKNLLYFLILTLLLSKLVIAQNEDKQGFYQPTNVILTDAFHKTNETLRMEEQGMTVGHYGSTLETGTTTVAGEYFAVQILADAVVDSLVDTTRSGDAVNGLALTAGTIIYGNFTRVKLQSGKMLCYKKQ